MRPVTSVGRCDPGLRCGGPGRGVASRGEAENTEGPAPKRRALERLVVETGQAERPANPDLIACAMAMTE